MEVTQEVEVEFDGEVEIDVEELTKEKAKELIKALLDRHFLLDYNMDSTKVKIPICHSFTTEVTIDIEPDEFP